MDDFFNKLLLIDEYNDDQYKQIEMFKSSFNECTDLSNYSIDNLQFLCIEDDEENALFTFPNTCIVARYFFVFFDEPTSWSVPERHELCVGTTSTLNGVELLDNSSHAIQYVLYPFEQCCDLPLSYLIPTMGTFLDTSSLTQIYESGCKLHHQIKWSDNLTLVFYDNKQYKVMLNGNFLSGFSDNPTHFQLGDCGTLAYIDKYDNLIVCQYGDVSSVVIVKKNFSN